MLRGNAPLNFQAFSYARCAGVSTKVPADTPTALPCLDAIQRFPSDALTNLRHPSEAEVARYGG